MSCGLQRGNCAKNVNDCAFITFSKLIFTVHTFSMTCNKCATNHISVSRTAFKCQCCSQAACKNKQQHNLCSLKDHLIELFKIVTGLINLANSPTELSESIRVANESTYDSLTELKDSCQCIITVKPFSCSYMLCITYQHNLQIYSLFMCNVSAKFMSNHNVINDKKNVKKKVN